MPRPITYLSESEEREIRFTAALPRRDSAASGADLIKQFRFDSIWRAAVAAMQREKIDVNSWIMTYYYLLLLSLFEQFIEWRAAAHGWNEEGEKSVFNCCEIGNGANFNAILSWRHRFVRHRELRSQAIHRKKNRFSMAKFTFVCTFVHDTAHWFNWLRQKHGVIRPDQSVP